MKPYTRELHSGLIRQLRGMLTVWEKWLNAAYLDGLPEGTPQDVLKILTPDKRPPDKRQ
jgi:hypothetical protein